MKINDFNHKSDKFDIFITKIFLEGWTLSYTELL